MKPNIAKSILFSLVFFLCTYVVMAIVSVLLGGIMNLLYLIPVVKYFLPALIVLVITYYIMIIVVLPWISNKMLGDDPATTSLGVRIGSCLAALPMLFLLVVGLIFDAHITSTSNVIGLIMAYKMFRFGKMISFCAPLSSDGDM